MKLLVILMSLGPRANGEDFVSHREECRKRIAGLYLQAYDDKMKAQDRAIYLKEQLEKETKMLAIKKNDLKQKNDLAVRNEFDIKLAQDRDGAQHVVKTIEAQIKDLEKLLVESSQKKKDTAHKIDEIKILLDPIFDISIRSDYQGKPYPVKVDYKKECPKYRYTCPMTREDARYFKKKIAPLDGTNSCEKYISYSAIE